MSQLLMSPTTKYKPSWPLSTAKVNEKVKMACKKNPAKTSNHHGPQFLSSAGGHGIDRDWQQAGDWFQQAGDTAMAAMKGKLATSYYMQAEEAWGNAEEEEKEENSMVEP